MRENLKERLFGLDVSPRAFLFFSIVSILAPVFTDVQESDSLIDIGLELVLGALATLALALFLWPTLPLVQTLMRPGWARLGALAGVILTGGAVRGLVLHFVGPEFLYVVDTTVFERVANSASTTLGWLVVLSLFTSATYDFRAQYQATLSRALYRRAAGVSSTELREVLNRVQGDLRKVTLPPMSPDTSSGDLERVAEVLRADVVQTIRNHSRDLWSLRGASPPVLRLFPLLKLALARLDYSVAFLFVIYGLLGFGNAATVVGPAEAALRILGTLGVLFVLDRVWRKWLRPVAKNQPWVNAIYLLFLGFAAMFPMGSFEFFVTGTLASYLFLPVLLLPVGVLVLIESTINLAELAREELLDLISNLSQEDSSSGEPEEARSSSDLASYLHNSLQAEIQSIIYALEAAVGNPGNVSLGQASLERLRMLTSRSLDEDFDSFSRVPKDHLHTLIENWRGILDITLDWGLPPSFDHDARLPTVVNIIQEVSSNSVTHAAATTLHVSVFVLEEDIGVTIHNNADFVQPTGEGQGTSWLDSFLTAPPKTQKGQPKTILSFRV